MAWNAPKNAQVSGSAAMLIAPHPNGVIQLALGKTSADAKLTMMQARPNREQRWSARQTIETGIRVYSRGQRSWQGCMGNLSIGGVFAKIDADTLALNDPVDVAFVLNRGDIATHHRLPARPGPASCLPTSVGKPWRFCGRHYIPASFEWDSKRRSRLLVDWTTQGRHFFRRESK